MRLLKRKKPSKPSRPPRRRDRLPVDQGSMEAWLASAEWEYLLDLLRETRTASREELQGCDPNDAAKVAKCQAEARCMSHFLDGEVAEAMTTEVRERKGASEIEL